MANLIDMEYSLIIKMKTSTMVNGLTVKGTVKDYNTCNVVMFMMVTLKMVRKMVTGFYLTQMAIDSRETS